MCGGQAAYEEAIATRRFRPVAMSVFASGAIAPREAREYVCGQPKIESVVFGKDDARQVTAMFSTEEDAKALAVDLMHFARSQSHERIGT